MSDKAKKKTQNLGNSTDLEALIDSVLDDEYLKKASLMEDLVSVTTLTLIINTSVQSLYDIGYRLPSLKELKLDHSFIGSIRDLGVDFKNLVSLSLNDCSLQDIDGISVFPVLKQLSLDDNSIDDVSPLAMHDTLEV